MGREGEGARRDGERRRARERACLPLSMLFWCDMSVSSSMSLFFLRSASFFCATLSACSSLFVSACRLSDDRRHSVFFFSNSSVTSASLARACHLWEGGA